MFDAIYEVEDFKFILTRHEQGAGACTRMHCAWRTCAAFDNTGRAGRNLAQEREQGKLGANRAGMERARPEAHARHRVAQGTWRRAMRA